MVFLFFIFALVCTDTSGWKSVNNKGKPERDCNYYREHYCENGIPEEFHKEFEFGPDHNNPESNCCGCGKDKGNLLPDNMYKCCCTNIFQNIMYQCINHKLNISVCARPKGWCTDNSFTPGATYAYIDCDGDGVIVKETQFLVDIYIIERQNDNVSNFYIK